MTSLQPPKTELLTISWLHSDYSIVFQVSAVLGGITILVLVLFSVWRLWSNRSSFRHFEIDQAEIGTGNGKMRFKPNHTDRQVAYAIWVELSTRKIGLPIDVEHDVISEIYASWYSFFGVTRELIKSIPVNKVRNESTQQIIRLSIDVLNEGLRPHLTMWQARFRYWYEAELKKADNGVFLDPQEIQREFPKFEELKADMEKVNRYLIKYREKMRQLVD